MALDNALIEAQKVGKTPALCDPESVFQTDYSACNLCVLANDNSTSPSNTTAIFAPYIDFCTNLNGSSTDPAQESYISSQQSQASLVSSVEAQYSSLGLLSSLTVTQAFTTVVTQTPSQTSTTTCKLSKVSNPQKNYWHSKHLHLALQYHPPETATTDG